MKKRFISFVSAIAVAFVAFAQVSEKAVQFTAVQDEASLAAGKRYIVVAEAAEGLVALSDQYNGTTSYRLQSDVLTVEGDAVVTPVAAAVAEENLAVPYVLVLEGAPGEWKLYDEVNGKYLHWTSKRAMELDEEGSVWSISINENGEAEIALENQDRVVEQIIDRSIRYGAEDSRFACYADPKIQTAVKLYEPVLANSFIETYAELELLTETYPSIWMIPAVSEKFFAVQEAGYAIKENLFAASAEEIDALSASINETIAYVKAMDAKYNEFKDLLLLCYDYQDNSTASSEVTAAFAEVVDLYAGYQWSFPAASVEEFDAMILELKNASFDYAAEATPNDGFEFDCVVYESAWVGALPADAMATYLYNTSAKAFLGAGNSWGTQGSFTTTGVEWILGGGNNVYTLDGQISNGGDSHYFGGEWTDAAATDFVFELVGKNLFTLKYGDKYVAYDGTNIVANVTEVNDGCYWQLVTKAERQSKYPEATADNPVDATFEISGANFSRNDGANSAWSGSPDINGGNAYENFCAEKWNAGIVEVAQVLRGMPAGMYRLSAQGFYRMGSIEAAAAARTEGTEVLNAKFFANGDSIAMMSVMEECDKLAEGADYPGFGKAPNTMEEASHYFSAGYYEHTFEFVLTEGVDTIKLGATKTGSVDADWMIFDNFRLEYLGINMEVESPWVGTQPENGKTYFLYNPSAKAFLRAANSWGTRASFGEEAYPVILEGDADVYALSTTLSFAGKYMRPDLFMDQTKTDFTFKKVGDNLYAIYLAENGYVAYTGVNTVEYSAELTEDCCWQLLTEEAILEQMKQATVENPYAITALIPGANFGRTDNRNSAWSGSPKLDGDNDNFNGEKWNAGITEVSQVLRGMPNGVYRLNVQGFYRMGGVPEAAAARTAGTEVLHAKFFANGDSIPVMSVIDEAGKLDVGSVYEGYGKAPNSQGDATKFFNAGLYEHSFLFTLKEGVDSIKLGATKTGSVAGDWLVFDNYRLEYLGVAGEENFLGNGVITSMPEGDHYVYYTDAEGKNHFLNAAGANKWVVSDAPVAVTFSAGNTTEDPFAGYASFMASNGFYMSNAANDDGTGAIKTELITGSNGSKKRTWESQVFYKNGAGKHAIRLTNSKGTSWGANCFVNIDPATLAIVSGQPTLGDALYLWEVASVDDPRFTTEALNGLIEQAEALTGACDKDVRAALDAAVAAAKEATTVDQVAEVKAALEAAIEDAKASIAEYAVLYQTIEKANSILVEGIDPYEDLAEVVELAEIRYAEGTVDEQDESILAELEAAMAAYIEAIEAYVVADAVVNGDFSDGINSWTGDMGTGNHNKWTNVNDGFAEKWTPAPGTLADMDFYQEISGLPAGTYTFAAYVNACQQGNDDSYEVSGVSLFANGESVAVHTINIDRDATNQAIGAEFVMVTTTIAAGETLKVGMSVKGTDANWVVIDNAKLYNFGEGYNTANTTGIDEVELGEVAGREFFNAAGVAVDAPVQGITIVKTTYANGVVKVSKVFVK